MLVKTQVNLKINGVDVEDVDVDIDLDEIDTNELIDAVESGGDWIVVEAGAKDDILRRANGLVDMLKIGDKKSAAAECKRFLEDVTGRTI